MASMRLLIVSEQQLFRRALAAWLQPSWQVAEAGNSSQVCSLARTFQPDVLLVDLELGVEAVAEVIRLARLRWPKVKVVIFGCPGSSRWVLDVFRFGIHGYVSSATDPETFLKVLDEVMAGRCTISPTTIAEILNGAGQGDRILGELAHKKLTPREREILRHLVTGATNKEIAKSLAISECTVKNHIHNILDKLQVDNRAQLVSYALTYGLVGLFSICPVLYKLTASCFNAFLV